MTAYQDNILRIVTYQSSMKGMSMHVLRSVSDHIGLNGGSGSCVLALSDGGLTHGLRENSRMYDLHWLLAMKGLT